MSTEPTPFGSLHAPWRMSYLTTLGEGGAKAPTPRPTCFLCDAAAAPVSDYAHHLVLHRDPRGVILLNRYPYSSGHLLVSPLEHVADLPDVPDPPGPTGLMALIVLAQRILVEAYHPQGVNIGLNIGRAAGAGVPGHLHAHLVPRWLGDANYMTTLAGLRVIPQALEDSYAQLAAAMARVGA